MQYGYLCAQEHLLGKSLVEPAVHRKKPTEEIVRMHEKLVAALADQQAAATETSRKLRRQIDGMRAKQAEATRELATLTTRKRAAETRKLWPRRIRRTLRRSGLGPLG